ncbi:MAG TPA: amidohydrolase family protein [Bacteroidales bacterium]|nr:amidohydrolase family protein [Bacteroidales bacterium]
MRRFSAQYVITNSGPVLKRAIISVDEEGRIVGVEDTGGNLPEERNIEFYNGIIVPGFVNCHCHLELSHLGKSIPEGTGLLNFIEHVRNNRSLSAENIISAAEAEDKAMYRRGISLCADICNTADTFQLKTTSLVKYHNFIELFGIDPSGAGKRINEALQLIDEAGKKGLNATLTPHSFYSVSAELFNLLLIKAGKNKISTIHFMESPHERQYLLNNSGPIPSSYLRWGLLKSKTHPADYKTLLRQLPGTLILVHNTFIDQEDINLAKERGNIFFCLCPVSNNFIENSKPPIDMLIKNGCDLVIGTDSLASNRKLDIMSEMISLQLSFPELIITDMVRWATINGAVALNEEQEFGAIEIGKKPGLVLIENADLQNMKLLPESASTRLI